MTLGVGLVPKSIFPSQIPGLRAWYKADAGVFKNAGKTAPCLLTGDVPAVWADQSWNGNDLTSVSGTVTFVANSQNGLPGVLFGFGKITGGSTIPTPWTVIASLASTIFHGSTFFTGVVGSASTNIAGIAQDSQGAGWYMFDSAANQLGEASGASPAILQAEMNGIYSQFFIGNGAPATRTLVNSGSNLSGISIGGLPNGTHFGGPVYEVIILSGVLDSTTRTRVYNYLHSKWNI